MGTLIAGGAVIAVCALAVMSMVRDRRRGIPSCGSGCTSCGGCSLHCDPEKIPERFKLKKR